jgi:hypothetical protein
VLPVPWLFDLPLKLLINRSPACNNPVLRGTSAIPYGFTSPAGGTVEPNEVTFEKDARNAPELETLAEALAKPPLTASSKQAPKPPKPILTTSSARSATTLDLIRICDLSCL